MARCFIIQPFDNGPFDDRYDDIIKPAVIAAEFEPYRVDRDPAVIIPIEDIEKNIRNSDCCLADISLDNPNVWYEVGFAFASGKDVVLVCSKERLKFPFDVSHRNIITYSTHAPRNFEKLESDITARLLSLSRREKRIEELSPIQPTDGLTPHELTALVLLMGDRLAFDDTTSTFDIVEQMQRAGFTKIAASLALECLRQKGFIEQTQETDEHGERPRWVFLVKDLGVRWCLDNQHRFVMKVEKKAGKNVRPPFSPPEDDDDIPF